MDEIIIKKHNDSILIEKKDPKAKKNQKLEEEKMISYDFLNPTNNSKNNNTIKKLFSTIFSNLNRNNKNQIICETYENLSNIKNKNELEKIFLYFIKNNYAPISDDLPYCNSRLLKMYQENKDDILNIFTKLIIQKFFRLKISYLPTEDLNNYGVTKPENIPIEKIAEQLGIDFQDEKKESKFFTICKNEIIKEIEKSYKRNREHQCWGCPVPILDCSKILDIEKKGIQEYDYILDGEQVYSKTGELESFIVSRCLKKERLLNKR